MVSGGHDPHWQLGHDLRSGQPARTPVAFELLRLVRAYRRQPPPSASRGANHVKTLSAWQANVPDNKLEKVRQRLQEEIQRRHVVQQRQDRAGCWLRHERAQYRSAEGRQNPEGMKLQGDTAAVDEADDHQLVAPFISTFTKAGGRV
jgi:hypothetical protein